MLFDDGAIVQGEAQQEIATSGEVLQSAEIAISVFNFAVFVFARKNLVNLIGRHKFRDDRLEIGG